MSFKDNEELNMLLFQLERHFQRPEDHFGGDGVPDQEFNAQVNGTIGCADAPVP